jgi:uncharacterized membrane-anchored protein
MLKEIGRWIARAAFVVCVVSMHTPGLAAEPSADPARDEMGKLPWQKGPLTGTVGDKARIMVPADAALLPEASGARFLELTGNIPQPGHTVIVSGDWFAIMSFNPAGYIKDDEKLDPDALLSSLKESDGPSNEERKRRGISQLHAEGWAVPPHYDPATKYLEWGLRLRSEDSPRPVINYTVRLLGRTGYESVTLVSSPESLQKDVGELKTMLTSFDFNSGEKYSEFKPGDHVAEFGLGALVLGGAAAAMAKTGLWKTILVALAASWKLVAGAAIALFAAIGRIFRRNRP